MGKTLLKKTTTVAKLKGRMTKSVQIVNGWLSGGINGIVFGKGPLSYSKNNQFHQLMHFLYPKQSQSAINGPTKRVIIGL